MKSFEEICAENVLDPDEVREGVVALLIKEGFRRNRREEGGGTEQIYVRGTEKVKSKYSLRGVCGDIWVRLINFTDKSKELIGKLNRYLDRTKRVECIMLYG